MDCRRSMESAGPTSSPTSKRDYGLAATGIFTGLVSLVVIWSILASPTITSPADQLSAFQSRPDVWDVHAAALAMLAAFAIPWAALLASKLRSGGRGVAWATALLFTTGVTLVAVAWLVLVGGLNAIVAAGTPPTAAEPTYLAAILSTFQSSLGTVGDLLGGFGLFLAAWLIWRTGTLPRWLTIVGFIGGIGGATSILVPFGNTVLFGAAIVWWTTTGILALRRGGALQAGPSPRRPTNRPAHPEAGALGAAGPRDPSGSSSRRR